MRKFIVGSILLFIAASTCYSQATFNLGLHNYILEDSTWSFRESTSGSKTSYRNRTSWDSDSYLQGHLRYNPGPNRNDYRLNYRLKYPVAHNDTFDPGYPLIVMLHGAGERGNCWNNNCYWATKSWNPNSNNPQAGPSSNSNLFNNDHNLLHGGRQHRDAVNLAGTKLPNDPTLDTRAFPGFVLFPQNEDGWNGSQVEDVIRVIYLLIQQENIDPNRVYIHGLSNGAQNVVTTIKKDPSLFAAVLLMSPSQSNTKVQGDTTISHLPLWVFQGGKDKNPSPSQTESLIRWFEELGGIARYTYYGNLGHGTWNSAYAEPDFFTWMREKNKADIHVYYGDTTLCATSNQGVKLGLAYNFPAYQWEKDNEIIPGANDATYIATEPGVYRARFSRISASPTEPEWNIWSKPVIVKESVPITPTVIADGSTHLPDLNGRDSVVFSMSVQSNVLYDWYRNDVLLPNDTLSSFTAKTAGVYSAGTVTFGGCPSNISDLSYVTINAAQTLSTPSNIQAVVTSPGSIQLFWQDNSPNEDGFEIYRAINPSGPYTFAGIVGEDVISFHDLNLSPNQTYYYNLRAVSDNAVSPYTGNISVSTGTDIQAPSAPQNLASTSFTLTSITLNWDFSTDNTGIAQYFVYYGADSVATGSSDTFFTLTGLMAQSTFNITVKAQDLHGNISAPSNQISVATVFEGLNYEHSTGAWEDLDEIDWSSPEFTGHVNNFTLSPSTQDDFFNFKFDGYLFINQGGDYDFRLRSDDGSKLYIGGFEPQYLLVDNDGLHGCSTNNITGTSNLSAGAHAITVIFFERSGGQCLEVEYRGPDTGNSWIDIPDSALKSGDTGSSTPPTAPSNLIATASGMSSIDLAWDAVAYPSDLNIVVLGSSTAEGTGASTYDSSWVGRLDSWLGDNMTNHSLTNLALGGFTTEDIRQDGSSPAPDVNRNITHALSLSPDIILINLPSNNVQQNIPVTTTMDHYREIKASADSAGVMVLFTTTQPRNFGAPKRLLLEEEADSVRAAFGSFVIDIYDSLTNFSNQNTLKTEFDSGDGIHLNNSGHNYVFNTALAKLNQFLTNYEIYRSEDNSTFQLIDRTDSIGYIDLELTPTTTYYYKIKAVDKNGVSNFSNTANATTLQDLLAPSAPTNLQAISTTYTNTGITWDLSTDNVGVTGYEVIIDGDSIGTSAFNTFFTNILQPDNTYQIKVKAFDASGNKSGESNTIIVNTTPPTIFYSKAAGDLNDLNTWSDTMDGTGSAPPNFSYNGQYFLVTNRTSAALNADWQVEGSVSRVLVDDNVSVSLNSTLVGKIYLQGTSTLSIDHDFMPELESLSDNSTVIFNTYTDIPTSSYGNLILNGSGIKKIDGNEIMVAGNLTVADGVGLKGNPENGTSMEITGDLNMEGTTLTASSDNRVTLRLSGGVSHNFTINSDQHFYDLILNTADTLNIINAGTPLSINLGSLNGGGLLLHAGSVLDIDNNTLALTNNSAINPGGESGKIAADHGSILISSASSSDGHFHFSKTKRNVEDFVVDLTGSAQLYIQDTVNIMNHLKLHNGTVHSQNNIVVKSNAGYSASIPEIEGSGLITGNITTERYIEPNGRIWRYFSSPVGGITVADWQESLPITGPFVGSSTGPGLSSTPSMYEYDETQGGWLAYPTIDNQEPIVMGKGYSVFVRETVNPTTIVSNGTPYQGDVTFSITPGTSSDQDGWNLIGNPYQSDIVWDEAGWTSSGIGDVIYIRNNNGDGSGQFVVWDRTTDSGTLENGKIPAGQSFWVQSSNSSPTLVLHESAKTSEPASNNTTFYRVGSDTENYVAYGLIVELANSAHEDQAFLKFTAEGDDKYEKLKDGIKRPNTFHNLSTFSKDSLALVVNDLSNEFCTKSVGIEIDNAELGEYKLQFKNVDSFDLGKIQLEDKFTGQLSDVVVDDFEVKFDITSDTLTYKDRFVIHVQRPEIDVSKSVQLAQDQFCIDEEQTFITVENSQPAVAYTVVDSDLNPLSEPIFGNGKDINLSVAIDSLAIGNNEIRIEASFPGCGTNYLDQSSYLQVNELPEVSTNLNLVQACRFTDVKIEVTGSGNSYVWTNLIDGQQYDETSATLNLYTTDDYTALEVAAVSASGCISKSRQVIEVMADSLSVPEISFQDGQLITETVGDLQWYVNNEIIDGANGLAHTPSTSGDYTVSITENGCTQFSESLTYSITDLDSDLDSDNLSLIVFPNPTNEGESMTVAGTSVNNKEVVIKLYNTIGHVLINEVIDYETYHKGYVLDDKVGSGLYILQVTQGSSSMQRKVLIR